MKAKNISGQAPGGKRTPLAQVLPLKTPFVVQVFPIYACNFRCRYCIFSLQKERRGFISSKIRLDPSLFERCVHDMSYFPEKIKVLRFVGIGEPLLHTGLPEMVACASRVQVAQTIEIITNGSLLTPRLTDSLLSAGLTRLVVSVQGTSAEKYKHVSGVDLDFDEFIKNLEYFHANKGDAHVYIKVVDTALDSPEDERRFFEIYGDLCDTIAVEHTVPIHSKVDYSSVLGDKTPAVTQFGAPISEVKICPQPFFTMQINPDGKVVPCYSWDYPTVVGDCNVTAVPEIWNGADFNRFRRIMLDGTSKASRACSECTIIRYRMFPEDDLLAEAERLKNIYEDTS